MLELKKWKKEDIFHGTKNMGKLIGFIGLGCLFLEMITIICLFMNWDWITAELLRQIVALTMFAGFNILFLIMVIIGFFGKEKETKSHEECLKDEYI